jgi:hypothetical protein
MKLNIALITIASMAWTANAAIVLGPTEAATGPVANGTAAINVTASEAKIGTGAWQANGTAKSSYTLYSNATGKDHGLGQLNINDLTGLNFSTFKTSTGGSAVDWYLTIYTVNTSGGVKDANNDATWYGRRLTLEGLYANNFANPANQWNTWSTDAGVNQLTIFDGNRTAFGWYYPPTLADIQGGPVNWASFGDPKGSGTFDYSNLNILGIVLETGSGWASGFTGLVDDVGISTTKGNLVFDLEATVPVPEPSTYIAGALLLLPFAVSTVRRFRRNHQA